MASIPILSLALTKMGELPHKASIRSARFFVSLRISVLLIRRMMGIFLLFNSRNQRRSSLRSGFAFEASPPQRSNAISVFSTACRVRSMRRSPSSPSSSNPGVSTNRQGPIPGTSIALLTGSVVVPGRSETRAVSCPVSALIRDDLPLFLLPKSVICSRLAWGVCVKFINRCLIELYELKSEISFACGYLFQVPDSYLSDFGVRNPVCFFANQCQTFFAGVFRSVIFQILFQRHQRVRSAAVGYLPRFDQRHEAVARSSFPVACRAKAGDIPQVEQPAYYFIERSGIACIKLCRVFFRKFFFGVPADTCTRASADLRYA